MSERPHAHMVYIPTELFLALKGKCWSLKIGESAAILDCINESLYREGFIDEETYQRFRERYRKPLLEIVKEREAPSVKVQVNATRLEVERSSIAVKSVDYSKLGVDELLERYKRAKLRNDVVTVQMILGEAMKRGYRFQFDEDTGKVDIISLRR